MDNKTEQLRVAFKKMQESEDKQRSAADSARKAQDKANINIQKSQKKADLARLDQQLASIGEAAPATMDEGSSPALTELQNEVVRLRQATIENGKLLRAILERL